MFHGKLKYDKNILRLQTLKNNNIEAHQNFTGCYKKCEGSGLTPNTQKIKK